MTFVAVVGTDNNTDLILFFVRAIESCGGEGEREQRIKLELFILKIDVMHWVYDITTTAM